MRAREAEVRRELEASGAEGASAHPAVAPLAAEALDPLLRAALAEDEGSGDLTSRWSVPEGARALARLVAKERGTLAGLPVFARVFELCDPAARVELLRFDGERVDAGTELARVEGCARALLLAERTALNFAQRMSGIATLTARYVELAAGRARVLDTRKTTPGLRLFEKYAVRCGGGENHRFGLYDEVMIKDNHAALSALPLEQLTARVRRAVGDGVRMTVEARSGDEALAAARGGADVVLLDNVSPAAMAPICAALRALAGGRRLEIEASGGISLERVAEVARSGIDRMSIGALTHSAPALDLALYLEPLP